MRRTIDIFVDDAWAGTASLSETGRIEGCDAVLSPNGDVDENETIYERIEAAIESGGEQRVRVGDHDYSWSLGEV